MPLNVLLGQVLMQIKDDPSLKWLEKMKGDPNKRNKNKYCHFHRDHGHDMDECYDLKQQIENLIRQGKLRNFLRRDHKDEKLKGKPEEPSQPLLREISHCTRNFSREIFQVKEDLLESGVERPTL